MSADEAAEEAGRSLRDFAAEMRRQAPGWALLGQVPKAAEFLFFYGGDRPDAVNEVIQQLRGHGIRYLVHKYGAVQENGPVFCPIWAIEANSVNELLAAKKDPQLQRALESRWIIRGATRAWPGWWKRNK